MDHSYGQGFEACLGNGPSKQGLIVLQLGRVTAGLGEDLKLPEMGPSRGHGCFDFSLWATPLRPIIGVEHIQ